jgi:hypothetical protein
MLFVHDLAIASHEIREKTGKKDKTAEIAGLQRADG